MTDQPALFGVDTPAVTKPRHRGSSAHPRWSKYQPSTPVKCDDCLMVLAEADGRGPATRNARWRRAVAGTDLVLCYAHAQLRRADDGLTPLTYEGTA